LKDYLLKPGESAIIKFSQGDTTIDLKIATEPYAFYEMIITRGVPLGYDIYLYPNSTSYSSQFQWEYVRATGNGWGTSSGFMLHHKISSAVPILVFLDIPHKRITAIGTASLVACASDWNNTTDSWKALGYIQLGSGATSEGEIVIRRII